MPDSSPQVVTMSLLRYEGWRSRWWAFTQMGLGPGRFAKVKGLQTVKMLGSGAGNGFSIWPNFGVYGLLGIWVNETAAQNFFRENSWWRSASQYSEERYTIFMKNTMAHGEWGGEKPFTPAASFDPAAPIAVITRATIYPKYLWRFWRFVPKVSASVDNKPGRLLSVGVGEWPLFMQATFSVWESGLQMMDYAYKSPFHREVVQKTRELGWYKEELFARFLPYASRGSWEGQDPVAALKPETYRSL